MSWLFAIPWTVARQAPLSMGFSRQQYGSGMPYPRPGGLPDPGIEPRSPALQADPSLTEPAGKPCAVEARAFLSTLPEPGLAPASGASVGFSISLSRMTAVFWDLSIWLWGWSSFAYRFVAEVWPIKGRGCLTKGRFLGVGEQVEGEWVDHITAAETALRGSDVIRV